MYDIIFVFIRVQFDFVHIHDRSMCCPSNKLSSMYMPFQMLTHIRRIMNSWAHTFKLIGLQSTFISWMYDEGDGRLTDWLVGWNSILQQGKLVYQNDLKYFYACRRKSVWQLLKFIWIQPSEYDRVSVCTLFFKVRLSEPNGKKAFIWRASIIRNSMAINVWMNP